MNAEPGRQIRHRIHSRMNHETIMIFVSFAFFLLIFVAIGVLSTLRHKKTNVDYLLAGQNVKPWLVALSAIATYNSGYMFIGMIGYTYLEGLSSIWLMIGWIVGDFLMSLFIHARLRRVSENRDVLTYSGALSSWNGTNYRVLRFAGGLITILFLGGYAAGQLEAGSKALHVLFGWNYALGAIIGAVIVVLYCFAGGIRASIWTDAAQSIVMIASMGILCTVGIQSAGGPQAFIQAIQNISPTYTSIFPHDMRLGPTLGPAIWVVGWLFAGFGVIGQPHVMVRFMSMNDVSDMPRTRLYYYCWYTAFFSLTILVGLVSRVLIPRTASFDAELALPTLALDLLPEALVGLILAGLFAATMSTADSQILSCSASATRDIYQGSGVKYIYTKIATVAVALLALAIAVSGTQSVFLIIMVSAGALASAFSPLLAVLALGQKPSEKLALAMMVSGAAVSLGWRFAGLSDITYEIMPGMLAGLAVFAIGKLAGQEGGVSESTSPQTGHRLEKREESSSSRRP